MTKIEFTQFRDSLINWVADEVVKPNVHNNTQIERRYIVPENRETDWLGLLKNDAGKIDIVLITPLSRNSAERGMTAGGKQFNFDFLVAIDYYYKYLQGTDAQNTQAIFDAVVDGIQFDLEKKRGCVPKGAVKSYRLPTMIKKMSQSVHYLKGDVELSLNGLRYD